MRSNPVIGFLLIFVFAVCPLMALLFVVRLVVEAFSAKVSKHLLRHPWLHLVWACFAFIGVLVWLGILDQTMWPPLSLERAEQRRKLMTRVESAGGWEAVQRSCETLASNYPGGLVWWFPNSNAWVYPYPGTDPEKYDLTNITNFPLPSALAALHPMEVLFHPSSKVTLVRIRIFGMHATGAHSTPYFGLQIVCGTNAPHYLPPPTYGGVPGEHYDSYNRVTDNIFEIY